MLELVWRPKFSLKFRLQQSSIVNHWRRLLEVVRFLDVPIQRILAFLGWDEIPGKRAVDLDMFVLMLAREKKTGELKCSSDRFVFFNNKSTPSKSVLFQEDNLTGARAGIDETILIDFAKVPADVEEIVLYISIFQAATRNQTFADLTDDSFLTIIDANTTIKYAHHDLKKISPNTGINVVAAHFRREAKSWTDKIPHNTDLTNSGKETIDDLWTRYGEQ